MKRVGRIGTACVDLVRGRIATFCIWLLTAFIMRDPMMRHDARLSIRRAFTHREMRGAGRSAPAGPNLKQTKFFWFQQAVRARLQRMKTTNAITIRAPLPAIFAAASDLARWPDFLPHYRYNRFLSPMPWGGIVKMSAVRSGIPTTWISDYRVDTEQCQLHFKHLRSALNATRGMDRHLELHRDAGGRAWWKLRTNWICVGR